MRCHSDAFGRVGRIGGARTAGICGQGGPSCTRSGPGGRTRGSRMGRSWASRTVKEETRCRSLLALLVHSVEQRTKNM
jgi:hypothetical protein